MRLIINGYDIELPIGVTIAQTKQVNDLVSLSSRQSNYTNTFNIPKTANNIKAFNFLGLVGNNSNVPYQRNECYLYDDEGLCFVNNGWAIITETNDFYKCNVYDGVIDFYKAIENKNLSELDLTEINHIKNLTTIVDSWDVSSPYKYIIADYNGKAVVDGNINHINADYLVPSVNVKWLFNKVHEFFGFNYIGEFLTSFNFENLWMTFPKGISEAGLEEDILYSEQLQDENFGFGSPVTQKYLKVENFPPVNNFLATIDNIHFQIDPSQEGTFKVKITGEIAPTLVYAEDSGNTMELWIGKNANGISDAQNAIPFVKIGDCVLDEVTNIDIEQIVSLNGYETMCILLITPQEQSPRKVFANVITTVNDPTGIYVTVPLKIDIKKIEGADIDFNLSFIDFKVKDFINEIVWRFALTPYYDVVTNTINYKQLVEILQNPEVDNWTSKFDSVNSESYVYGSYAKENLLTPKYNDENSDYYNGSININNQNLDDSKVIISSKIYAPEKELSNVFEKSTNVYKLWNKEVKDNGEVTYKSLDKRFYFLRFDNYTFENVTQLRSEVLSDFVNITTVPFESYYHLPFTDIVQDNYLEIYQILNQAKLINANLFLNNEDIATVDFSKLKYIEQLGNYFLLNKISNYTKKGLTKCELIKVDYVAPEIVTPFKNILTAYLDGCLNFTSANGETSPFDGLYYYEISTDGGATWSSYETYYGVSPICGLGLLSGDKIRFINPFNGNVISNILTV